MAGLDVIHGGGLILGMDRIGFGYLGLFGGRWDRLLVWLLEGVMGWCLAGWSSLLVCFVCEGCGSGRWLRTCEVDSGRRAGCKITLGTMMSDQLPSKCLFRLVLAFWWCE